jgi:hypothetical protein
MKRFGIALLSAFVVCLVLPAQAHAHSNSIGYLDVAVMSDLGVLRLEGWSLSQGHPNVALGLRFRVNGLIVDKFEYWTGNKARPDVEAVYPGQAANAGFVKYVAIKEQGTVTVCAESNDQGNWTQVGGCKQVNTGTFNYPSSPFYGWQFVRQSNSMPMKYLFLNPAPSPVFSSMVADGSQKWANVSGGRMNWTYDFAYTPNVDRVTQIYFDPNTKAGSPSALGALRRAYYTDCASATATDSLPEPLIEQRDGCTAWANEISFYVPAINNPQWGLSSADLRSGVAAHEIGHGMGLGHRLNVSQSSIMGYNYLTVTAPTSSDAANAFSYLYYAR